MSSANVSKYEFLLGKDVLPEKDLLEKSKVQTNIAKKLYQGLNKFFKSDEKEEPTLKKYNTSDLIYNSKYSF